MKKQRYIIEEVPVGQKGNLHRILKGEWHGQWIDEDTLVAYVDADVFELDALAAKPEVTVLESVHDTTPINDQVTAKGKAAFKQRLSAHGIDDKTTVAEAGLRLAKKFKNKNLEPR
jgi:hypothetical protein